MNLYELNEAQQDLLSKVENGDMTNEEIADTIESLDFEVKEKIDGYCRVRANMKKDLDAIQQEIDRLTLFKKTKQGEIRRLEDWMLSGMEKSGKTKFDTGLFKGYFRKSPDTVEVVDIHEVPDKYVTTKVVQDIDKNAIKAAIKDGAVAGVKRKTGKVSLILK